MSLAKPGLQRPPAELVFAKELAKLAEADGGAVPAGWRLSPQAVEKFILGDKAHGIRRKFVGDKSVLERIIVSLAASRGVMLIGQPGTAKSWLSELLCAAISGRSTLTIQGGALTNVQQLLYSWSPRIVQAQGYCMEALVAGPLLVAMREGLLVRYEEMARATPVLQNALLSILSERSLVVPEISGEQSTIFAHTGFNVIGTSNTVDLGVDAMSMALKRRLNFETISPIDKVDDEVVIVQAEAQRMFRQAGIDLQLDSHLIYYLVAMFHELRTGETLGGRSTDRLAGTVMSTAEAVAVAHAMGVYAWYYNEGVVTLEHMVRFLVGTALKDSPDDRRRLRHYFDKELSSRTDGMWPAIYALRDQI